MATEQQEIDDRDYNKYINYMHLRIRKDDFAEMAVCTMIYAGLGLYIVYQYLMTNQNEPLVVGWWGIGGLIYYKYGWKKWF